MLNPLFFSCCCFTFVGVESIVCTYVVETVEALSAPVKVVNVENNKKKIMI